MGLPLVHEAGFRRAVEQHRHELRVHCARIVGSYDEAEDLVQETMLRAWRSRATFAHDERIRGWLYRIATNVCLDELQRRRRPVAELLPPPAPEPADVAARREAIAAALSAMERLPHRQRAAIVLRDVLDRPAADVAQRLQISVPAANSALQRARARLRAELPAAYAA